ncbi:MAG: AAA family ATPase, partial [Coriobacteriales bacterium]|nr:AAA family ATPase [Coriobacteriales bacterium]
MADVSDYRMVVEKAYSYLDIVLKELVAKPAEELLGRDWLKVLSNKDAKFPPSANDRRFLLSLFNLKWQTPEKRAVFRSIGVDDFRSTQIGNLYFISNKFAHQDQLFGNLDEVAAICSNICGVLALLGFEEYSQNIVDAYRLNIGEELNYIPIRAGLVPSEAAEEQREDSLSLSTMLATIGNMTWIPFNPPLFSDRDLEMLAKAELVPPEVIDGIVDKIEFKQLVTVILGGTVLYNSIIKLLVCHRMRKKGASFRLKQIGPQILADAVPAEAYCSDYTDDSDTPSGQLIAIYDYAPDASPLLSRITSSSSLESVNEQLGYDPCMLVFCTLQQVAHEYQDAAELDGQFMGSNLRKHGLDRWYQDYRVPLRFRSPELLEMCDSLLVSERHGSLLTMGKHQATYFLPQLMLLACANVSNTALSEPTSLLLRLFVGEANTNTNTNTNTNASDAVFVELLCGSTYHEYLDALKRISSDETAIREGEAFLRGMLLAGQEIDSFRDSHRMWIIALTLMLQESCRKHTNELDITEDFELMKDSEPIKEYLTRLISNTDSAETADQLDTILVIIEIITELVPVATGLEESKGSEDLSIMAKAYGVLELGIPSYDLDDSQSSPEETIAKCRDLILEAYDKAMEMPNPFYAAAASTGETAAKAETGQTQQAESQTSQKPGTLDFKQLRGSLKSVVIGQDEVIDECVDIIRVDESPLKQRTSPTSFLFAGPTGTGKTFLAEQLAEQLGLPAMRLDMSEFNDKAAINRLIGSPPGYVGSMTDAQLVSWVKENPRSLILFDEIDKAEPQVLDILLQILDKGEFSSGSGAKFNLAGSIVICTTNASQDAINQAKKPVGFAQSDTDASYSGPALTSIRKFFRPEFINRFRKVCVFKHFSPSDVRKL